MDEEDFKTINDFFDVLKERTVSFENIKDEATELYKFNYEKNQQNRIENKEKYISLLGSIAQRRGENLNQTFMGINVQDAYREYNVDDPREMFYAKNFLEQFRNRLISSANKNGEVGPHL